MNPRIIRSPKEAFNYASFVGIADDNVSNGAWVACKSGGSEVLGFRQVFTLQDGYEEFVPVADYFRDAIIQRANEIVVYRRSDAHDFYSTDFGIITKLIQAENILDIAVLDYIIISRTPSGIKFKSAREAGIISSLHWSIIKTQKENPYVSGE